MGIFHVFKIVQMVPNRANRLIRFLAFITQLHIILTSNKKQVKNI